MKTFEELGVSPEIRRAIEEMGYACPMPVQEEVIPYLLGENNDVVALAQTGTGEQITLQNGRVRLWMIKSPLSICLAAMTAYLFWI